MKLQLAIDKRSSVRSFERKKVPRNVIKKLVANGVKAPSACNSQPWIFYCIDNKVKRDKISKLLHGIYFELQDQLVSKSSKVKNVALEFYDDMGDAQSVVFAFRKRIKGEAEYVKPNDIASISCAIENIMLSAVEKKLGTCFVGSFGGEENEKKLKKILGNKKDEELISAFVIGYPMKGHIPLKRDKKKISEVLKFK